MRAFLGAFFTIDMNAEYSILFQKEGVETSVTDLQDSFGFVCTKISEGTIEVKQLESVNWFDSDGDDVYVPANMSISGMDIEINLVYSGVCGTYRKKVDELVGYLTTNLGEKGLMVYSKFHNRGYRACFLKSISESSLFKGPTEECYECKMVLRTESPRERMMVYTNQQTLKPYIHLEQNQ